MPCHRLLLPHYGFYAIWWIKRKVIVGGGEKPELPTVQWASRRIFLDANLIGYG